MLRGMFLIECEACGCYFVQHRLAGSNVSDWANLCDSLLKAARKNGWYVSSTVHLCSVCVASEIIPGPNNSP